MEENSNKSQLERIIFFSDAVIAIAMTLLIIEIKAPHLTDLSDAGISKSINELIPKFVSFFISFFVIAIYWKAHHNLFGYVKKYTDKLIWLNIFFLLSIVIMPFSSAFYSENFHLNFPFIIYCLNIFVTGLLTCWLIRYISSSKENLSSVSGNNIWRKYYTLRSLVPSFIFFLSLLISFYSTNLSRICFILIFPMIFLLRYRYENKIITVNKSIPAQNEIESSDDDVLK